MVGKTRSFSYDCTKLLKSGAYLYIVELKNMPSRDPIVGSGTNERFIHLDFMIWKNAKETERKDSLFETRAKLLDPCQDFEKGEFCHWKALKDFFIRENTFGEV